MNSHLETASAQSDQSTDSELVERQRRRIAELEDLASELPDLRRRLLELEQLLAELPDLRRRSERLDEIEASPALRLVNRARERGRLRAASSMRSARAEAKRALGAVARRAAGEDSDR